MAVSCPEVMYGAYYPYLYGRAGPSRSFYQYERFNQDLYSSSGVPLTSSSASASSHSPCSPILPPSIALNASQTAATTIPTIPLGAHHQRSITKEEDLSATRHSDTEGEALMKALAVKGHDVTVISPFPQKKSLKNFYDITVPSIQRLEDNAHPSNIIELENMGTLEKLRVSLKFGITMTNYTLNHKVFRNFLHDNKVDYDVIVMQIFMSEAFLGLGHYFNAPVVGFSPFGASKWSNDMVGTPTPMSYIPHHFLVKFSDRMSYYQRVRNVLAYFLESIFMDWCYMPQQEQMYNEIFPDPKLRLDVLYKNVSLVLLNNHFSLHFPRPYVPNMIEVGGLQINRTPKKLPMDLQKILDEAEHGVIYFSLGSNIKSKNLPIEKQIEILNVFRKLKQIVLWKWDDPLVSDKLNNVHVNSWYPQNDLLAHPNVKLFITHGGLLSHAIPVIGIPVFADQHLNIAEAESAGIALSIPIRELNEDTLSISITEILTNDKYAKKVKLMSDRYRDQPLTPMETAIYWTEYVARHKGAPHLRSAGLDLSFFEYHSLDVFATLLGLIYFVWKLIKWCCCKVVFKLCKTNSKKDANKKRR